MTSLFSLLLLSLAPPIAQEEHAHPDFGFAFDVREGWEYELVSSSSTGLHAKLTSDEPFAELSVRVMPRPRFEGPLDVRAEAERSVAGSGQYRNVRLDDRRFLGEERPTFLVDVDHRGAVQTLQQFYLFANDSLYILQTLAPSDGYEERWPALAEVWAGFRLTDVSGERLERRRLEGLAERCGSEIAWCSSWTEAQERARAEKKLVLWRIHRYRGFTFPDTDLWSSLMEPEIVELVNERYVPLRGTDLDVPFAAPELYGMSGTTFGAAYLLVDAEGRVVREKYEPLEAFLLAGLDADPDSPGPERERVDDPLARARLLVRRGELEEARASLADASGPEAHRLAADLDRRARDGEGALEHLAAARAASGDPELAHALDVDEAVVRIGLGQFDRAARLLEQVLASREGGSLASEARFQLGLLRMETEGLAAAEETWSPLLVDEDDRFAWRVAGILTSPVWQAGMAWPISWRDEATRNAGTVPPPLPLAPGSEKRAQAEALGYLLRTQRPDGSWLVPSDVSRREDRPPHDFKLAAAAICGRGLLAHREREDCAKAIDRAIDFVLRAYDEMRAAGDEVFFMDYGVWSRGFALLFLADAVVAGAREPGELEPYAERMIAELAEKQKPMGGWSYYVTSDLDSANAPANQAMSFTTAALCVALLRALDAGFDVPTELVDAGLDGLERLRTESGTFAYSGGAGTPAPTSARAAAGRAPICSLALFLAGRAEPDELRRALRDFTTHADGLAKERGKVLMHTGPEGQGSHYVMFDYAFAAEATAALPIEEQSRHALPLFEALLAAHLQGGGFLGTPVVGVPTETGLALGALNALLGAGAGD